MKRYALWALIAALAWWVIQDPAAASHFAHAVVGGLGHAARSLSTLTSGL